MPANLPPQYYELEKQFNKETDISEKLRLAKELLALMPKHKGTDKLQAEMKAKISKLKQDLEGGGKKHGAHHTDPFSHIEREGAAQVILIGPPNSGKSSLLDYLTHARPHIGDYPYTTLEPLPGMMPYPTDSREKTIQIQLIDTPPVPIQSFGIAGPAAAYLPNLIRHADLAMIVLDIADPDLPNYLPEFAKHIDEKNIAFIHPDGSPGDNPRLTYKKALIAAHKYITPDSEGDLTKIIAPFDKLPVVPTSILEDDLMEKFKAAVFKHLYIIRVYTKRVGHEPDYVDPIILPIGATVHDAAQKLHKDFAQKMQFAKIWGHSKFEGQRVKDNYVLSDNDIVEFHI